MAKASRAEEQVRKVIDTGIDNLPEIFDMLMDEAKGVYFAVCPTIPGREKPKPANAKFVTLSKEVEKVCKTCQQPLLKEPHVVWEVWKEKRDGGLLRFLYDQLAGKSKARDAEKVDTEIIVVFGDIDSVLNGETGVANEASESKGSLPRKEKETIGLDP